MQLSEALELFDRILRRAGRRCPGFGSLGGLVCGTLALQGVLAPLARVVRACADRCRAQDRSASYEWRGSSYSFPSGSERPSASMISGAAATTLGAPT